MVQTWGFFLLSVCDPDQVITFSTSIFAEEEFEKNLDAGTYYLVVDKKEKLNGLLGNYNLTVQLIEEVEPEFDCASAEVMTITEDNRSVTLSNQSTANGQNNVENYFVEATGGPFNPRTGPELVYQINWPGGNMIATLETTAGAPLDMFILNECDPGHCHPLENRCRSSKSR